MKETVVQKKLKEKLLETGISAHALEKKAGLKRSAVQNILHGRSKKPSAEILQAVAKVLGCNIYELIGQEVENDAPLLDIAIDMTTPNQEYNGRLYYEAVKIANNIFKTKDITSTSQAAINFINSIYNYAIETNVATIDVRFAEWLARKHFAEKMPKK